MILFQNSAKKYMDKYCSLITSLIIVLYLDGNIISYQYYHEFLLVYTIHILPP